MEEADASQDGEPAADAPPAAPLDLTNVRGFQVLASAGEASSDAAPPDEETRRHELAKEFTARSARFSEAVDGAIVLANDGAIRWLGDPVAKLIAGEEMLKPRAVVLADDALPAEGREAAQQRVALWLAAHIRKTLGPLFALGEVESVPESVRDLALKLSQSLGILERERVKNQVKALDQNARGALRKLGVRFGAHYLYMPALLKPAARALCAQLWALSRGEAEKEAVAEKLLHFASSGRTSFAVEPPASPEVYRVSGFRLCGDRAVRVDIVERLSDLIRAALPRHVATEAGPSDEASLTGFVVSNQMTSLTGCSGDHFASILRSLGFASHQVNKAAYLAALKAAGPSAPMASPPSESQAIPPAEPDAQGNASEASEAASESAPVEEASPVTAIADEGQTSSEDASIALERPPVEDEDLVASPETAATQEPAAEEPAIEELTSEDPAVEEPVSEELTSAKLISKDLTSSLPAAETSPPEAATPAEAAGAAEAELIEIWRPAPRRPRHSGRDHGRQHRDAKAAAPTEAVAAQEGSPRKPWRDRPRSGAGRPGRPDGARASEAPAPADGGPQAGEPGREGRRPPWRRDGAKGGRFEENRNTEAGADRAKARPQPTEPRKPSVNLDSPFAKLLDLKPLLKARDKGK